MSRMKLYGLLVLCAAPLLMAADVAWGEICNGETPFLGNCGEESKCEDRTTSSACTGSYGRYYEEMGGTDCMTGTADSFCIQSSGTNPTRIKCTCEFYCEWDEMSFMCTKGDAHMNGQSQVCSQQNEYVRKQCTISS